MVGFFLPCREEQCGSGTVGFLFVFMLSAVGISEHFSYSLPPGDQQVTSFAT